MRYGRRKLFVKPKPVETVEAVETEPGELRDASGRLWDAERYQSDENGEPRYSTLGNFKLKPGQSHAEEEETSEE